MKPDEKIITLVMGKRGSGKSYLVKQWCRQYERLLIYDPQGEYIDGVIIDDISELKNFWIKVYRKKFRIIYRPIDAENEFEPICKLVWECHNITFIVEEVQSFCNPQSICYDFKALISKGRHRDIELIGVTQRPAEISKLLTSQAKRMCIFNVTDPNDIKYFTQTFGMEFIEKLDQLQQYNYIVWRDGMEQLEIERA